MTKARALSLGMVKDNGDDLGSLLKELTLNFNNWS